MSYQIDVSRTLWSVTFSESLTSSDLLELRKALETLGQGGEFAPSNGWIDLRGISDSDIGFHNLAGLTEAARDYPMQNDMKIAVIAATPFQYGCARMFQMLLNHQQVEVAIFKVDEDAIEWLAGDSTQQGLGDAGTP